ncbi:unnamed protein product, partial [Musa acuminata subsp. burmannicoides]
VGANSTRQGRNQHKPPAAQGRSRRAWKERQSLLPHVVVEIRRTQCLGSRSQSMILLPPAPQNSPSSAYRVSASPALHVRLEARRSHCCPPPRCGRIRSMAATRRSQLLWS